MLFFAQQARNYSLQSNFSSHNTSQKKRKVLSFEISSNKDQEYKDKL